MINLFNINFLFKELSTLSKAGVFNTDTPKCIESTINNRFAIRDYQRIAFAYFIYYNEKYKKKIIPMHLLFHMATGSGKTLMMAGLMLYLYSKGYRDFIFFVNNLNIIDKTRDNFLNFSIENSKYLFEEVISIDSNRLSVNEIENLYDSSDGCINIIFTTIQQLHSDLNNPKENRLSFGDFEDRKIVLLSDEAHHIQAKTKKKTLDLFGQSKPTWENTVEKIFNTNENNILLEFTATIDLSKKELIEKYKSKIIYSYDLKSYREDGYSKDIVIVRSDLNDIERMLYAVILSQYKLEIALSNNIGIKPVILFKEQSRIEKSKQNEERFIEMIANLSTTHLFNFRIKNSDDLLMNKMFSFFEAKGIDMDDVIATVKRWIF